VSSPPRPWLCSRRSWGLPQRPERALFPQLRDDRRARSTVAEALKALEDAGILTWVQRVKRIRERCSDLLGDNGCRWRVLRTSNAYNFRDPGSLSKSEKPTGTPNQDFSSPMWRSGRASAPSGTPLAVAIRRSDGSPMPNDELLRFI
jgi:hypothetical protein